MSTRESTDPDAPLGRLARITWADEITPEPVRWAWTDEGNGRIPAGALVVAAGREGTGKSSFGIWQTAHITRGTLPGAYCGRARRVLYVAVEDSWKHTLVPRLMAAGADLSMVGQFDVVTELGGETTLSLPHDNDLLEQTITEYDVALVVVDPLMSVIGAGVDTHRERDTRTALDPLARIADRTGCVILGIAHFSKGAGHDAASLITGSGAFKNVPRAVFGFARDEDDEDGGRVMTQVKNSLGFDNLPSLAYRIESAVVDTPSGPATTGRFTFTGTAERSVADLLRAARDGGDNDDRREASDWLIDFLGGKGGQASAQDVFKAGAAEGFSRHVLKRAKGKAVKSVKAGMSGGWVWELDPTQLPEGCTKGAKGAGNETLHSSRPSVLPSRAEETLPQPTLLAPAPESDPGEDPPEAGDRPACADCGEALSEQRIAVGSPICAACVPRRRARVSA